MTKSIEYKDFSVGKDLRKDKSVAEPNRLRSLQNALVTTGKDIQKRPGSLKIATLETGTKGLYGANGKLNTFYESGSITHANNLFKANQIDHGSVTTPVNKIHFADIVDGFIYIAAEYDNGDVKHHYLDGGSPTRITDANNPNSKQVVKMEEKVWAVGPGVVKYSATGNPRDWTLANDAGFIATNRFQAGAEDPTALAQFQSGLVVFHINGAQLWNVDPDPALIVRQQSIDGAQTRYHRAIAPLSSDLFFLSDAGYRSISRSIQTDSANDIDVGSPIDRDVAQFLPATVNDPISIFFAKRGEFWSAIGNRVWMFKFSRTAKVSAWSDYIYPWPIEDFTQLDGDLYMRSGDDVYKVDETLFEDDGTPIAVEIIMPFNDAKSPGVNKMFTGADIVTTGTGDLSFRYDSRNESFETDVQKLSGDTRPGDLTPVEVMTTSIAPVIRHSANEDFQLHAIELYFEPLGVV